MWKTSRRGAELVWIYLIHRCRSNRIRNFHGICIGAVMHRGGMAVDQADILKIVCFRMDTERVRLRDGDAGLQNPSRSLDKHEKIH